MMQRVMDPEQRPDSTTDHQPKQERTPTDEAEKNQEQQLDEGTESPG